MNNRLRRFSLLGLVSLPLIAIAVAVIAFSSGFFSTHSSQATTFGAGVMTLRIKSGGACDVPANPTKCTVPTGGKFMLGVEFTNLPGAGFIGWAAQVNYSGLTYTGIGAAGSAEIKDSPDVLKAKDATAPPVVSWAGATGLIPPFPVSTFKGNAINASFSCPAGGPSVQTLTLVAFDATTNPGGSKYKDDAGNDAVTSDGPVTINCVPAPTNTPIPTATNTPTPTNTPTTVPIPRMQKCNVADAVSVSCGNLQNIWLVRQGTKIPPARCVDGTSQAILVERIHIPIGGVDPKNPSQARQLGGFSFQIKYDPLKVCVILGAGPAWHASGGGGQICTIQDSVTAPTLQGVASIHCVTLGKSTVVDTTNPVNRILATIQVKAQPAIYSQARPNQDNGQAVQLIDEGCKLTDLQAHAIEVFSCESADVTIRYLEGDVEPDCQINTLDTQAEAFRWNAHKGQLAFSDRFNLTPAGGKDQIIDVNDLQFVYGRFGSTCAHPQEGGAPINPKQ